MVVVAVIVKKVVNESLYCCCLLLLGPQGAQKQVTLQQEGVGLSGSPDGGPERASGCPKVTQTGPTGANGSPQHSPWPKDWGFLLLPLGDDFPIVTWQQRACLAGIHPGSGAGVRYRCWEVLVASSASWACPEGQGLAITPSCGCNWFSSLSLPPSLSACFSLLFPALSVPPAAHPSPPPPTALGGTPFFRPPSSSPGPACFLAVCPRR